MRIPRRSFLAGLVGLLAAPFLPATGRSETPLPLLEPDPAWLEAWKRAPRIPLVSLDDVEDPVLAQLITATRRHQELAFRYHGGSTPGELRRISPGLVFRPEGYQGIYLSGYCHERRQERVFRVDSIELIQDERYA